MSTHTEEDAINLPKQVGPTELLVREIAMDIGKQVVAHIEWAYPEMFKAVSQNAKLSIRNCVHNEIITAVRMADEGRSEEWIAKCSKHRREMRKAMKSWR